VAPQSIKAPRVVSRKATGSQSQAVTTISVTAVSLRPVRDDEPDVTDVPIGHLLPGIAEPARGSVAGTDRPHEQMSDTDGPVVGDGPARVVRDFPHVAIRVGEGSGHAAPLGACRRPHDLPAGLVGLGK
jgi:hypothetical protein